eukprot:2982058-Prymnesium_polylepis.1
MVQYVVGTYDAEIVDSELAFIKYSEEEYALLCGRAIARTLSKNKKDVPGGAATHRTREIHKILFSKATDWSTANFREALEGCRCVVIAGSEKYTRSVDFDLDSQ